MDLSHLPLLTALIVLPLVGAFLVFLLPRADEEAQRTVSLVFAFITFLVSIALWIGFRVDGDLWQFERSVPWIAMLGANYHVGIDGVSLVFILLTTLMTFLGILSSYTAITDKVKAYYAFILLLEAGMLGIFIARDLLLFYVFWEAALIPLYFLIGIWGGPNRIRAAVKFLLYTMVGSLLMLVSILVLYFYHQKVTGVSTFDLAQLMGTPIPGRLQGWLFFTFFLAFAIKLPLFPFHTWLPDAYAEAPSGVLIIGVLLKLGTYGFYRFAMPLFPMASRFWLPIIAVLSLIAIIYGGLIAIQQKDLKRLVSYSSVSHLGFVMLGLFALNEEGVTGSIVQSLNHAISTGILMLLLGTIFERRRTQQMDDFGGIWAVMPSCGVLFLIGILSSVALPGTNGFVGEFPILLGAFARHPIYGIIGALGMILGAVYFLMMFRNVFQGPLTEANRSLKDLNEREWLVLAPLVVLVFAIGIFPNPLIQRIRPSVQAFVAQMDAPEIGKVALNGSLGR
jgi:NADH-quinone oxidoreductase subunit M